MPEFNCPVCGGVEFSAVSAPTAEITPYLSCNDCGMWSQFPLPEFRWESELQPANGREAMHEVAVAITEDLAERLHRNCKPSSVLDIGAKYPYFLKCFKDLGVERTLGIDGCHEALSFGQELGVQMLAGDFLTQDFGDEKFDLITLVHCIEHFSDPRAALLKIKSLLTEKGSVYIRTPETQTVGVGMHLSTEHYSVHPILFSREAFRRLARAVGFSIFDEWVQDELGQVDWQMKHKEDVRVSFAVVSCDEEDVIGRMLDSIAPIAWEVVVYLNNSTDRTADIIKEFGKNTGIQTTILNGYWDDNFARAKNAAIMACTGTHVAWMDCDDVLSPESPALILDLLAERPDHPQDWRLIYGGDTFFHLRLWKNEGRPYKPHFHDRCHEYVQLGGYGKLKIKCDNITLRHLPQPKDASGRNVRILEKSVEEGPQACEFCDGMHDDEGRTLFYFGNGLREAGRNEEALECYDKYLFKGLGWHDEQFWAWMYKGYCHQNLGDAVAAQHAYCNALAKNAHWAEPYMAIARLRYQDRSWKGAISWAVHAASQELPNTLMFLNTGAYKDQPWRLISWCWEHLGELDKAIQFAEAATQKIESHDPEWEQRIINLRAKRDGNKAAQDSKIFQVMRPGALGDILMSTAACKGLKEKGYFVRYVCHPSSVEAITDNPYVDQVVTVSENTWESMAEATKDLPKAEHTGYFQYPLNEDYPEKPMRQHLSKFFCEQVDVKPSTDLSMGFKQEHLDYGAANGGGKVVIHTTAGWSPLKNWPMDWWEELVKGIKDLGFDVAQIGSDTEDVVPGAIKLDTPSIRHAAAVQKFSSLFIGVDSIFNHTSQAVGKRSIILWGSTHPCGSGYEQNINLVNGKVWEVGMGNEDPTKKCQPCYREYNSMSAHPKPPCSNLVVHATTTLPADEYPARTLNSCVASNCPELVLKYVKEILS